MNKRMPGFSKFMYAPRCLERIQIPVGYTKYRRGNLPSTVILKDRYENHWPVEVEKVGSQLFFGKGWEIFVQENHVEVGDIIIFNYGGHNVLSIMLFGRDYCLKKGIGGLKIEEVVKSDQEIAEVEERKQEIDKEKEASEGTQNDSTDNSRCHGSKAKGVKQLQTKKLVSQKRAKFSNKESQTVANEDEGKLGSSPDKSHDDGSIELVSHGREPIDTITKKEVNRRPKRITGAPNHLRDYVSILK